MGRGCRVRGGWRRTSSWIALLGLWGCGGDDGGPTTPPVPQIPPEISLSPTTVSFQTTQGSPLPGPQTVSITNGRPGALGGLAVATSYVGAASGWLIATLSGSTAPATLSLSLSAQTATPGTHTATVAVTAAGAANSPQSITVTMVVVAPPSIQVSPTSVAFSATAGGAAPSSKSVSVTNGGGGTVTGLSADVTYAGPTTGWLRASLSGVGLPATLTLSVDNAGLAAGTYDGAVVLSGSPPVAKVSVPVRLTLTAPPPPPTPAFPLSRGKKWRYLLFDSTTVVLGGVTTTVTRGELILHVLDDGTLEGRTAWRLHGYELGDVRSSSASFDVATYYLATDASGLWRYTGGSWRRVMPSTSNPVSGGTLLLGGVPKFNGDLTFKPSTVSVPAGSFTTTRADQYHREGFDTHYSAEQKQEIRVEHFASGIGSVSATWSVHHEKDLSQFGLYSERTVTLTHVDTGPFPALVTESAIHAGPADATLLDVPSLASGDVRQGDASTTLTDAAVGCSTACLAANSAGQKRFEDWYRFSQTGSGGIRIEVDYPASGENDLDVYVFQQVGGQLRFVTSSRQSKGRTELIRGTAAAGTYYIAIQAWDTSSGRSPYWLSLRRY